MNGNLLLLINEGFDRIILAVEHLRKKEPLPMFDDLLAAIRQASIPGQAIPTIKKVADKKALEAKAPTEKKKLKPLRLHPMKSYEYARACLKN